MTNPTHGMTLAPFTPTELDRYWSKVEKADGCWLWAGAVNPAGYGIFAFRRTSTNAHRAGYLIHHGEVGSGLVIDHLCRNRRCVNPDHLEAVTPKVNSTRSPLVLKSHCSKGHEFTPENTRTGARQRYCVTCVNERSRENMRRYRDKRRVEAG